MKKIKLFKADWTAILLRFYLLMTIVLAAGFSGMWWLALFSLPVFITCMLGITYQTEKDLVKSVPMDSTKRTSTSNRTAA